MIALMGGGVTGGEVTRMTLALVNLMFFSLAAGMWVSVHAHTQFDAMLRALALIGLLMFDSSAAFAGSQIDTATAIEKIELLGGKVTRDETVESRPVVTNSLNDRGSV